jgi:hypothetical protein
MAKYEVTYLYDGVERSVTVKAESEKDARNQVWDIARRDPGINQVSTPRRVG